MSVVPLDGVPRDYAWGSHRVIQRLLGLPEDGQPIAELWFGAHPHDPSPAGQRTLDALIEADPEGLLGARTVARFGPHLPYLVKILAADRPLSMQVHPTREQAGDGCAREDAAGIARDADKRNYRDANHKPELLCALTPFEALCGFRPVTDTLRLLDALRLPALIPVAELLGRPAGLRAAFTALLRDPDPASVADAVADAVGRLPDEWAGPAQAVRQCAQAFPGDVGVVLALLLNHVVLEPGEAIYLGAGSVHAYLGGTGVEIMANSDNVLRCGLTAKHINIPELLKITDFSPLAEPRWPSLRGRFDVPIPDFALTRLEIDEPVGLDDPGPCIVLCTAGQVTVADVGARAGHAVFVPPGQAVTISGAGLAFVASTA
ncbi:MAG TPA: mannose-6-phosphate isomerase, class I [Jatrophihabitans sp.]|jgi:mannose-6-phosphate isomerase|nr:mannose-6-phosphate isomerase, class I [Jatrophihabitans sp.]